MDRTQELTDVVANALQANRKLWITGTGSKRDWYAVDEAAELMSVVEHTGIVDYQPEELFVTARAGTPLKEIELVLAQSNQSFAFEPPHFFASGTIGGAVATGFSGPGRAWNGALRDAVLGVQMINGKAEQLTFGGQVMKNVAGYDVSRLLSGSWGALGVLLNVSLRVRPTPAHEKTISYAFDAERAVEFCRSLARQNIPVSASCWLEGRLYLRLSGSEVGLNAALEQVGGDMMPTSTFWNDLRDHQLDYFKPAAISAVRDPRASLWRVVVPPGAPVLETEQGRMLIEWGGGLRWIWHEDEEAIARYAQYNQGWYWGRGQKQPLESNQEVLMNKIKHAFDPQDIFQSPLLKASSPASSHPSGPVSHAH